MRTFSKYLLKKITSVSLLHKQLLRKKVKCPIICVLGYKRVGKTTFAVYIHEKYGYKIYNLAEPLKKMIMDMFEMTEDELEEHKVKEHALWKASSRTMMQEFGTEIFQNIVPGFIPGVPEKTFWVDKMIRKIKKDTSGKPIVIADLRFIHEYEALKKNFPEMVVVRIVNDNIIQNDTHVSENEHNAINADYTVLNNGTRKEFSGEIKKLFRTLTK